MPDSNAPGQAGQGTPTEGAPADGDKGFDFEHGYNELRPQYTRTTQELADARDRLSGYEGLIDALHNPDPAIQAEAMEALGLEAAETGSQKPSGPTDEEWVDPLEEEVADLRAWRAEVQQERELERDRQKNEELADLRDTYIDKAISNLEDTLKTVEKPDFKFTQREADILGNLAIGMAGTDGMPNVDGAYASLYTGDDSFLETNRSRWIGTKQGAAQAPSGAARSSAPKLEKAEDRVNYVDSRWRDLEDQQ